MVQWRVERNIGIVDKFGNIKIDTIYQHIKPLGKGYHAFKATDKPTILAHDFFDKDFNRLTKNSIEANYGEMICYIEREIWKQRWDLKTGKTGLINEKGTWGIQPQYDRFIAQMNTFLGYAEGLIGFARGEKWGFLEIKSAKEIITPEFDEVGYFSEGLCPVRKSSLWGLVNKNGNLLIPPKYKQIEDFENGYAKVWVESKEIVEELDNSAPVVEMGGQTYSRPTRSIEHIFVLIDKMGKEVENTRCKNIEKRGDIYLLEYEKGTKIFIPLKGIFIPDKQEDYIISQGGLKGGGVYTIQTPDKESRQVLVLPDFSFIKTPQGFTIEDFSKQSLVLKKDNLYSYCDWNGNVILPAQYKYASPFIDSKALVVLVNDEIQIINKKGGNLKSIGKRIMQNNKECYENKKGEVVAGE